MITDTATRSNKCHQAENVISRFAPGYWNSVYSENRTALTNLGLCVFKFVRRALQ